ncbi:MAG: ABC transporter substrate-binding protein [Bacteroidota bacterium]
MRKVLYTLSAASALLFSSCGSDTNTEGGLTPGKGGIYYGDVFKMNEVEDFRNLYPLNITEVASHRIANQVYEGLLKLNQADLKVIPALAEKWEKNDDATVWTFYLRKGVVFHDDSCFSGGKGREVTAEDFKWCFTQLCTYSPNNSQFDLTFKDRVKGASEYYNSTQNKGSLTGVEGLKVVDPYTLQITLNFPFAGFENILTMPGCWVYPKEAWEKYGEEMRVKCVGTGAFSVSKVKEGDYVILEKNQNYWQSDEYGNKLPYLDGIKFTFVKEKKQELLDFRQGKLDLVYRLPTEMIDEILADFNEAKEGNRAFQLQIEPAMSTFYYGFLNPSDIFKNKNVRLAFNYAIDREKIVNYTLKGEGIPGIYGMVPPTQAFESKGYDFKKIQGFRFDKELAQKYLADAGYPNGKGFPVITLQINSGGGDRNVLTAEAIRSMLKENLNIDVKIDPMPFSQHLDKLETGKSLFWRTSWIADYPDPETFLTLLYGGHVPKNLNDRSATNSVRYQNPVYDSVFMAAMKEPDETKRFELYMKADQIAISDAAFMPIFYDENYRMLQNNVKNFPANAMEYRDLSRVYFVPKEEPKKK